MGLGTNEIVGFRVGLNLKLGVLAGIEGFWITNKGWFGCCCLGIGGIFGVCLVVG